MPVKYDVVIALGGGVNRDGSLPLAVQKRVNKCVEIYLKGETEKFLMCGGGTGEISEADAMKNFLLSQSIPENDIFLEAESLNTVGNAWFAKTMFLDIHQWLEPVIVTSQFHMPRTKFIFSSVLGATYKPHFIAASDEDLDPVLLRRMAEKEQMWIGNHFKNPKLDYHALQKRSDLVKAGVYNKFPCQV